MSRRPPPLMFTGLAPGPDTEPDRDTVALMNEYDESCPLKREFLRDELGGPAAESEKRRTST